MVARYEVPGSREKQVPSRRERYDWVYGTFTVNSVYELGITRRQTRQRSFEDENEASLSCTSTGYRRTPPNRSDGVMRLVLPGTISPCRPDLGGLRNLN
jgi:hypothetical protein